MMFSVNNLSSSICRLQNGCYGSETNVVLWSNFTNLNVGNRYSIIKTMCYLDHCSAFNDTLGRSRCGRTSKHRRAQRIGYLPLVVALPPIRTHNLLQPKITVRLFHNSTQLMKTLAITPVS